MILSAAFLTAIGLAMLLVPERVLGVHGTQVDDATALLIRMSGALYVGFASLNWFARGNVAARRSKPIALGNFIHFTIVAGLLIHAAFHFGALELVFSAIIYSAFAIGFGFVSLNLSRDA